MKLENDHVLGVQSPPRKSYNPFDSDDEIEATNGHVKSNINCGYDIKSFETNADSLTFHLDNSDVSWEEAILTHSQILSRSSIADLNVDDSLSRKDTELFTDKKVTECVLPELPVSYKENGYHPVKDIAIDEGRPVHDKVSIKSRDNKGSENATAVLRLDGDIDEDEHLKLSFMESLKSRSDINLEEVVSSGIAETEIDEHAILEKQHAADPCEVDDLTNGNEVKLNPRKEQSHLSVENRVDLVDTGRESFCSGSPQLDEIGDSSYHKIEVKEKAASEDDDENTLSFEKIRESSTTVSISDTTEASTESSESVYEEATSSPFPEHSVPLESSESGGVNALSYNSKVELRSIILDFNSTTVKEKEEEETPQHIEAVAKPPEAQLMSRIDEGSVVDSDIENRVHGEMSFSTVTAPPSSITYMGPYAHTGSISFRSESSAGSTRSFAFPVLQGEWNSSPVRMAKAEHRNRKHRGWVHSVMCCKF